MALRVIHPEPDESRALADMTLFGIQGPGIFNRYAVDTALVAKVADDFVNEIREKGPYLVNISAEKVVRVFVDAAAELLKLGVNHIGVEITRDSTLLLFARLKERDLHLGIILDHLGDPEYEAVLDVFHQSEQQLSTHGSVDSVIWELRCLIGVPRRKLDYNRSTSVDELPTGSAATAGLQGDPVFAG